MVGDRAADNPRRMIRRRAWSRVLVADPSLDAALVDALWDDPDAAVAGGAMIKDGDRCTLADVRSSGGGRYVLKRFNRHGLVHGLLHVLLRSRARWCWTNAGRVLALGLRTPKPMAMLETRIGPLRDRSLYVCEFIPGQLLLDVVRDEATPPDRIERLADEFAPLWHALGRARIGHRDMKATNFIVDANDRLWMIDLDAMRRYPPGPLLARRRRKDLARFMKNWRDRPQVAAAFRARIDTAGVREGEPSTAAGEHGEATPATVDRSRS